MQASVYSINPKKDTDNNSLTFSFVNVLWAGHLGAASEGCWHQYLRANDMKRETGCQEGETGRNNSTRTVSPRRALRRKTQHPAERKPTWRHLSSAGFSPPVLRAAWARSDAHSTSRRITMTKHILQGCNWAGPLLESCRLLNATSIFIAGNHSHLLTI